MTVSYRILVIEDHSCECGNRWTHSYSILRGSLGSFGGSPIGPEAHLPFYNLSPRVAIRQDGCFRCALSRVPGPPLETERNQAPKAPKPKVEPDDLLDL